MKTKSKIDKILNKVTITVDKSLGKLSGIDLFPEKTKQANDFIAKHGLPNMHKA